MSTAKDKKGMGGADRHRERGLRWPRPRRVVGIQWTYLIVDARQQESFLVGHLSCPSAAELPRRAEPEPSRARGRGRETRHNNKLSLEIRVA